MRLSFSLTLHSLVYLIYCAGTEGIGLLTTEQIEEIQKIVAKPGTHEAADFIIRQVFEHPGMYFYL
jgi:hypothetical protein